jgi:hypothetical protein
MRVQFKLREGFFQDNFVVLFFERGRNFIMNN